MAGETALPQTAIVILTSEMGGLVVVIKRRLSIFECLNKCLLHVVGLLQCFEQEQLEWGQLWGLRVIVLRALLLTFVASCFVNTTLPRYLREELPMSLLHVAGLLHQYHRCLFRGKPPKRHTVLDAARNSRLVVVNGY